MKNIIKETFKLYFQPEMVQTPSLFARVTTHTKHNNDIIVVKFREK